MSLLQRTGVLCAVLPTLLLLLLVEPAPAQAPLSGAAAQAPAHRVTAPAAGADDAEARAADLPLVRLDDLLEDVEANNPSLRAAWLEADVLRARPAQVSALPDPMVMGTYLPFSLLTARGAQRSQWRVEQSIPFPGKLGLQGEIADLSADVAGFEAATFAHDLTVQVKQAYYTLYRIQEQVRLVETFQTRLDEFERIAATQYEVGAGMQQAILKAQVEKNTLSQRLLALDAQRRTAIETLAQLVNRPVEGAFEVRAALPEQPVADLDLLVALAHRLRPEADALAAAEARADRQIALARKQFLPDFGVNLTYFDLAASDVMPTATGRDALALGVSVKVPLQRGRLKAQLDEARLRAHQVQARQEALETSFSTQIADLASQLQREAEQLQLYEETLIPQAETTLEATLSAYTTGRTDFLDLLDAERMLFSLRMGAEESRARYLSASARLERALGVPSLDEAAEALTTPLFTPDQDR